MTISKLTVAALILTAAFGVGAPAEAQQMDCEVTRAFTSVKHRTWEMDYQLTLQTAWLGYWDANGNWVLNHNAYAQPDSPFMSTPLGNVWGGQMQELDPPFYYFNHGPVGYGPVYVDSATDCSAACETIDGVDFCVAGTYGTCTALKYRPGIDPASFTYPPSVPGALHGSGLVTSVGGLGVSTCVPMTSKPDLTASGITPVVAAAGTPVTFAATIINVTLNAGASQTRFQRATSVTGADATNIADVATAAIAVGSSASVSTTYTFTSAGTYYMRACADVGLAVDESNEGNNCGAWTAIAVSTPVPADLTAGGITPTTASLGQTRVLSGTISNLGGIAVPVSQGYFQVSAPNSKGNYAGAVSVPALSGGGSNTASFSYKFSYVGSYSVRLCADWTNIVTETNEGNNCGPWTDIIVSDNPVSSSVSCTVSSQSVAIGDSVTYTAHPVGAATSPYTWTAVDGATGFGSGSTAYRTFTAGGNYGMEVSATYAGDTAACPIVSVGNWCPAGTPDLSITATPSRVRSGEQVTVSWSASGVPGQNAECTVTGPGVSWSSEVGPVPACDASGFANPIIRTQSTYTLACAGYTKSVVVNVIPNFEEF